MSKKGYEVWCRSCGCIMKLRDGKFGRFYGCTGYPRCKNTVNERDAALEPEADDNWNEPRGDFE